MESKNYNFPFPPYSIQIEFMTALYKCIDEGKIGIFESPTGTGKSLSIICSSLTWLREYERSQFNASLGSDDVGDEPEWVIENLRREKKNQALQARSALEERLARAREREARAKQRSEQGESFPKRPKLSRPQDLENIEELEEEFLLDDYDSDRENPPRVIGLGELGLSNETQKLLKKLGISLSNINDEENDLVREGPKIFYCSRTHSQLSQFANELRRISLPPVIDTEDDPSTSPKDSRRVTEELKHLTLGSRKNLCINPKVNKLSASSSINEKCLDLQKPGTPLDHKCPFLPNKENKSLVTQFRDHAISKIRDIEDLGQLGKQMGICPYYASRAAIPESEIITLPYPLILQDSAREALGVSLDGHVVIIDEAHNLMDSICGIYSCEITLSQMQRGREQLILYLRKFRNKLKGKNRIYVTQIVRLLDSLIAYLQPKSTSRTPKDGEVQINELLNSKGVDQINLFKLNTYIHESRLARKVDGYTLHTGAKDQAEQQVSLEHLATPVLMQIQSFMLALMNPSSEGRFFFSIDESDISLSYMLLDAAPHFQTIVSSARSVILAGGTMSPIDDYLTHLLPYVDKERLMTLSCSHIVPSSSLVVYPLSQGPGGEDFEFTFEKRGKRDLIIAAGKALLQIISVVPDGVVAFFASYSYLETCLEIWSSAKLPTSRGHSNTLLEALRDKKPLFCEQKTSSQSGKSITQSFKSTTATSSSNTTAESILTSYTNAIRQPSTPSRGALLLAVLSGSLSEGINFSDSLGRCVVVFGLPFPNPQSATWKAKRAYISQKANSAARDSGKNVTEAEQMGQQAAAEFYLNSTMRAVNQAVGRAIRHKGDYAAIVLIDKRYESERVKTKLPGWMKESIVSGKNVGAVADGLVEFFEAKNGAG